MPTKICNTCNLTLDISNFGKLRKKNKIYYRNKCKQCRENGRKCEHGKRKQDCIEGDCNGSNRCEHGRKKYDCNEGDCNGSNRCEHGRIKYNCNEGDCNGSNMCEHGRKKANCNEGDCNGSGLCEHRQRKAECIEGDCNGNRICEHGNMKSRCIKCDGSRLCIHCKHIQVSKKRYVESLDKKVRCCAGCFYYYYPNDEIPRRYKLKQHYFNEKLIEEFGVNFFQYDKKIKCGCSGRMPDWFIDCFKYSIIIELDEDQHKYDNYFFVYRVHIKL